VEGDEEKEEKKRESSPPPHRTGKDKMMTSLAGSPHCPSPTEDINIVYTVPPAV
jgi:hypothetical protein